MQSKIFSILIALVMVTSFLLAACAAPSPTPTPAPAPAPTPGRVPTGEVVASIESFGAGTMDPNFTTTSQVPFLVIMYDNLVGTDLAGKEIGEGGIAESWELSDDKLTWTFYLHEDIQFQDGWGEVTAEDVKFSLDRVMSPESTAEGGIRMARVIEEVVVVDKYTVKIQLNKPQPFLTLDLSPFSSVDFGVIVPKKYIEQVGTKEFGLNPIGSGPYKLIEYLEGGYMRFEAVDNHWFIGVPKFKYVTVHQISEVATRMAMLYQGDLDMAGVTVAESKELQAKGFDLGVKPGAMVISYPAFYYLWHPDAQNVPQQDVRVRKALSLAINRQEILDTIFMGRGALKPSNYSMGSWEIAYDEKVLPPVPPYDPEQAKELLAEAGYPDGFKQTMYSFPRPGAPEHPLVNQAIASYWQEIGLEIDFISIEWGAMRKMTHAGEAVYGSAGLQATANRIYIGGAVLPDDYSTTTSGNFALNADLDKLAEEVRTATTVEEYIERMQKGEIYIQENYVAVPILEADEIFGLSPKLKGWVGNAIRNDLNIRGMAMLP